MAEIRCPMCGNSNPDHLEECQTCGARLKPLVSSGTEPGASSLPSADDASNDWMDSFRDASDDDETFEEDDLGEELPDWLTNSTIGEPEAEQEEGADIEEDADWLSDIRVDSNSSNLDELEEENVDDWGERLGDIESADDSPESQGEEDDDPLDWLTSIHGEILEDEEDPDSLDAGDLLAEIQKTDLDEDEEFPDWLVESTITEAEERASIPSETDAEEGDEDSVPGWLSSFSGVAVSAAETVSEDDDSKEIPDWLSSYDEKPAEEAEPAPEKEQEIPDWLQKPVDDNPAPEEDVEIDWLAEAPTEYKPEEEDSVIPDWLQSYQEDAKPKETPVETDKPETPGRDWLDEELAKADSVPAGAEDSVPEWLTSYTFDESQRQDDLPDWITDSSADLRESQPEEDPVTPTAEDSSPDWLKDFETESPLAASSAESEPVAPVGEESSPDWLKDFEAESPLSEQASEEGGSTPAIVGFDAGETSEEVPDWLSDVQTTASQGGTQGLTEPVSSWAFDDSSPTFSSSDDQDIDDLFDDSILPEWISDGKKGEDKSELAPAEKKEGSEDDLETGDLPDWLEAMRPVEGEETAIVASLVDYDQVKGDVEKVGPLSGLRALLPAEPAVARAGKPGAYSVKLQVTEKQQASIDLLREMVSAEQEPQPIAADPAISPQHVLRWIIAALLILVIFLTIGSADVPYPTTLSPEVDAVSKLIGQLDNSAPVLIAFDYEPGFSAELDTAADGVFNHLMIKGSRLALVSTSPMGPALGERFIRERQEDHNYQSGMQYANLGYISGGATGLLNFALSPKDAVRLAYSADLLETLNTEDSPATNVWLTEPLEGINTLADFALTIVITEDPDIARNWIEQVSPALRPNSLVMVISAQAEPMIRPYYEMVNNQVDGLITGIVGGAAYESRIGARSARGTWDAYGYTLLVACILIFFGAAYNLFLAKWNPDAGPGASAGKKKSKGRGKS